MSSDALTEDSYKPPGKRQSAGHDTTTMSTASTKSKSKFQKFYKQMKHNAQLNKNVDEAILPVKTAQPQQQPQQPPKPQQQPLSESDPGKFAQILIDKLQSLTKYDDHDYDDDDHAGDEAADDAERMIDEHVNRVFNQKLFISQSVVHKSSKEVDIDDQKRHVIKSDANNYDSGVSTRSVASIERVADWLAASSSSSTTTTCKQPMQQPIAAIKTTVAYYLPGEDVAYISTFSGRQPTLAQFKQLITKKGHFR
jgi:hypothetical protein